MTKSKRRITFRQIKIKDFEFLWQLRNAALKKYAAETWNRDKDRQRRNFTENFNPTDGKMVVADGRDAGYLFVSEKKSEVVLGSTRLLPEFQNRGVGAQLIKNVLAEARAKDQPVRLQVLKVNPVRNLYERLGFKGFGETETHFLMKSFC